MKRLPQLIFVIAEILLTLNIVTAGQAAHYYAPLSRLRRASSCRPRRCINRDAPNVTAPMDRETLRWAEFSTPRILPTAGGGPNISLANLSASSRAVKRICSRLEKNDSRANSQSALTFRDSRDSHKYWLAGRSCAPILKCSFRLATDQFAG
ncbi:MAG: hypothetical protein QOG23_2626 [Blastocatellia bacterium]|nr:hypothetical protein [Blastocatellia bacterium]